MVCFVVFGKFPFNILEIITDCSRMGGDTMNIFGQHFGASGSSVIIGSQVSYLCK